jgi:mono/diheme cytochrome c family protein
MSMVGKFAFVLGAGIVATSLAGAPPSAAQIASGDIVLGQQLAQQWCSSCHAVDAKPTQANDAAPSFLAIAKMPSTTSLSLQAWLQTPHPVMPNLQLTQPQIDDVLAYILSLKGDGSR